MTRLGSLCTGYGGLDLAAEFAFGPLRHVWHAENDPDPSTVLAAQWPGVPNLGDLTAVDWALVEPVEIVTAGFPCQPVSSAGRRRGVDDERWLWDDIADAVGRMDPRPGLLVLENVTGLLTANRGHAMARVVQRLAALGYVGRYRVVAASDVGAPHRRERVFIVAWPADADGGAVRQQPVGDAGSSGAAIAGGSGTRAPVSLLPTPTVSDANGPPLTLADPKYSQLRDRVLNFLPTPRATDGTKGGPNQRRASGDLMLPSAVMLLPMPKSSDFKRNDSAGERDRKSPALGAVGALLPTPNAAQGRNTGTPSRETATRRMYAEGRRFLDDAVALLPTPRATDGTKGGPNQRGSSGDLMLPSAVQADRWGDYARAVARWEHVTGCPAPDPTEPGTKGQPRLSARFVEWLMGLPAGWVTDHLPRNPALRVLGNGVVPHQAAHAIRELVSP